MKSVTRFVGLDYHQDSVQVCVMNAEGAVLANRSVEIDCHAILGVVEHVTERDLAPGRVSAVIESCSGAAHLAEELIERVQWIVTRAHPGIVGRMKHNPDKSDKTDAWILADLMRLGYLPKVWLAPEDIRQLRSLVRYRSQRGQRADEVQAPPAGDSPRALDQVAARDQSLGERLAGLVRVTRTGQDDRIPARRIPGETCPSAGGAPRS